ncbi:MATE family efflux transporter [Paenibacillus sp. Y412MC10]|uniref:MATE family efflux transporter n=1 Tax=Geobacillus sp. (strain Y412MC10) TaxID=481743 RepID=UPI001C92BB97|nr:MATE family efflux transporter [Paenibacillus sp. Y412MC10]
MSSRFAAGSIPKLLLSLALPAIAAQIVNALYNVVDRMLIGRMPGGGTFALTGLGIAFPLIMTISAFAALIGLGGAPLASMKLGEGKPKEAEKLLGSCCLMLLLVSGMLTAVLLCFHRPLLIAFGASGTTLPYASDYMGIYLLGTVSVLMSLGLNSFISIQGFAKTAMATVCAGAVLNAILAPLFIFPMHMGVRGAALATVISQTASAIWVLSFLTSRHSHLRLRLRNLRVNPRMACRILALGLSPFIM